MGRMSIAVTWQITSTSSEATEQLAENLGRKLCGGEVIELISDVGGGKTTFVRGLARGLGSPDKVASPTFTISREYRAGDRTLYHFDFYRLAQAGIMADELAELLDDPKAIVVVEWADVVENVLPPDRLAIQITATGEHERQLTFTCPEKYNYPREDT